MDDAGTETGPEGQRLDTADRLIAELLSGSRQAGPDDADRIAATIAGAPFSGRQVPVPSHLQRVYNGRPVRPVESSLLVHLLRRMIDDEQWTMGTTEADYLGDLHAAASLPEAAIGITGGGGGNLAFVVADTHRVVPARRLGRRPHPLLLVVYSANSGILLSGYQIPDSQLQQRAQAITWLRK